MTAGDHRAFSLESAYSEVAEAVARDAATARAVSLTLSYLFFVDALEREREAAAAAPRPRSVPLAQRIARTTSEPESSRTTGSRSSSSPSRLTGPIRIAGTMGWRKS